MGRWRADLMGLGPFEQRVRLYLPSIVPQLLGVATDAQDVGYGPDGVLRVGKFDVAFATVLEPSRPSLRCAWASVSQTAARRGRQLVPTVVVPSLSLVHQDFCREERINWVDLAGNARWHSGQVLVEVRGRPNTFAKPGRPRSVFEPRSSRIARLVLSSPTRPWSVVECARAADLDIGHASRILSRLAQDRLLVRGEDRRYTLPDPQMLLDVWRDAADFTKTPILRGHVSARSGEELLHSLAEGLSGLGIEHAATGLGAAWLYDRFAMFRQVTFYLTRWPLPAELKQLHFREEPIGANVWLTTPPDPGVFAGAKTLDGIPCVHPVQVYVDLKAHHERAQDAAEHLKTNPVLFGDLRAKEG